MLERWLLVQQKREYLEKVFASAELSRQLHESRRFSRAEQRWDKLMSKASNETVVGCCFGDEKLRSELDGLMAELEACYKAIAKYLEYKRDVFPRFYFVSSHDLLAVITSSITDATAPTLTPPLPSSWTWT